MAVALLPAQRIDHVGMVRWPSILRPADRAGAGRRSLGRHIVAKVGSPADRLAARIASAVKRGLDAEGFSVQVSFNGEDGLWRATEQHYDLLIVDLMLPGHDGFEICRVLREQGNWTPILVLTARDSEVDETRALETGADDYLVKPFAFPILVAHVRALLRRTSGTAPAIEVGDLRLDPARHRCWRGPTEIGLTAREFSMLEYLVRRAGLVTPKFEILRGVWEYDFDGDPNIVEVYIRRLRRKIDVPFGRHNIETVRGAGYRLAAYEG